MNGAESLLRTLVGSGVEACFGNPGTSEMHFVAALDSVEGMRAVLGLLRRGNRITAQEAENRPELTTVLPRLKELLQAADGRQTSHLYPTFM